MFPQITLTEAQQKELSDWIAEQRTKYDPMKVGAIGGAFTYSATPTSMGYIIEVTNSMTKEKLDLTDYGDW